jgi:hypothetical protein
MRNEGVIGGTSQSVGGPLDKPGMIRKHFNAHKSMGNIPAHGGEE